MIIDKETIIGYESQYRASFINSLAGLKQTFLIGTKSESGHSNLAIFNSLIHIGANPPLWGFISRPNTVRRDTLNNILETNQYTINYITTGDYIKGHQTSAKYDNDVSEFNACGFSEYYHPNFDAPFVKEAAVKIGMRLQEKIEIAINGTLLIIGSIEHIEIDESIIAPDGFVALDKADVLAGSGLDAYYKTSLIERLSYATTDKWPQSI